MIINKHVNIFIQSQTYVVTLKQQILLFSEGNLVIGWSMCSRPYFRHFENDEPTKKNKESAIIMMIVWVMCIFPEWSTSVVLTQGLMVWRVWCRASINARGFGFSLYSFSALLIMSTRWFALWFTWGHQNVTLFLFDLDKTIKQINILNMISYKPCWPDDVDYTDWHLHSQMHNHEIWQCPSNTQNAHFNQFYHVACYGNCVMLGSFTIVFKDRVRCSHFTCLVHSLWVCSRRIKTQMMSVLIQIIFWNNKIYIHQHDTV